MLRCKNLTYISTANVLEQIILEFGVGLHCGGEGLLKVNSTRYFLIKRIDLRGLVVLHDTAF